MKQKYRILEGTLPINLIKHSNDEGTATIDKILTVCAALTNITDRIVCK